MDEDRSAIATMRVITISREYGSGGGEIAARLAKRLAWQLIVSELRAQKRMRVIEGIASLFLPGGDLYGCLQSYKPSQKSSPLL